ncbi:MAG: diguanylate cyclase [Actinomycetota bacterium]|nr:diguanylate cyclase [Nitrospiraceae bacterium]MDA8157517.1 diguanylate cyclase [Actinomycetota bacterium]
MGKAKILLVEDNRGQANITKNFLEGSGYEVIWAADGKSTIKAAKTQSPDVIVLDLILPDISGREVCRYLKSSDDTRNIPIIMLTSKGGVGDEVKGLEGGADYYLKKPCAEAELNAHVFACLRTKALQDDLRRKNEEIKLNNQKIQRALDEVSGLILRAASGEGLDTRFSNPNLKKCYEEKNCGQKDCACFGQPALRCWQVAGTFCGGQVQGHFANKYHNCAECEVFEKAASDPVYRIGEHFNNMMHILSQKNEELKLAHLKALRQEQMALSLYKVSSVISHSISLDILIREVLDSISALEGFSADMGGIFVVEEDRMELISSLGHSQEFLDMHKGMRVGDCLCGMAAKTGEMIISGNSGGDIRHTFRSPDALPHGHVIVPLKTKDRVEGVLYLYTPVNIEINEDKINLLSSIGNQLGIAIENAKLYQRAQELSRKDSLTGLLNHEEIISALKKGLDRAVHEGTSLSVIMADLDHFKQVNDRRGHLAGDAVIRFVAHQVLSSIRVSDSAGRYGGEEFLIVLPSCDMKAALTKAERLRMSIEKGHIDYSTKNNPDEILRVTASFGVASSAKEHRLDAESLVHEADLALYRAKQNGRNRIEKAADALESQSMECRKGGNGSDN